MARSVLMTLMVFALLLQNSQSKSLLGIYDFASEWDDTYDAVKSMEQWIGYKYSTVHFFTGWCTPSWFNDHVFKVRLPQIWGNGSVPLMTWQPACYDPTYKSNSSFVKYVAQGAYDSYITTFANQMKTWLSGPDGTYGNSDDRRVYVRLGHEMNTQGSGSYPWSPANNPSITISDYINMWQKTVNIFKNVGITSTRLQWMWCPNNFDAGSVTAEQLFPGTAYVDWMCTDIYNGGSMWGLPWSAPVNLGFKSGQMLDRLKALAPNKPIAIAEFGTVGDNTQKGSWITDFYNLADQYNLKLISYFNVDSWVMNNIAEYKTVSTNLSRITFPDSNNPRLISDDDFLGTTTSATTTASSSTSTVSSSSSSSSSTSDSATTTSSASVTSTTTTGDNVAGDAGKVGLSIATIILAVLFSIAL